MKRSQVQVLVAPLRQRRRPRSGGAFFVVSELWSAHDAINHHYRRYRLHDLEALVRGSGLEVMESRYFFVWLAIVKWFVARKERVLRPVAKPPTVPPPAMNALVLAFSRFEQRLLGDAHPAFGSSAIVVARAKLS